MNYNIQENRLHDPDMTTDEHMPSKVGTLPLDMLAAKFEETDMDESEMQYNEYARRTLKDRRPDDILFEHEAPRGKTSAVTGRLNLQYYGTRGTANPPAHPEMFMGFDEREPRGIATEPDMRKMVEQQRARLRFKRMYADESCTITGGERNESKIIEDNKKLMVWMKDRLKVFSTSVDGRRNGLRREYRHKSAVADTVRMQGWGEFITDQGLNPQRRANIVSGKLIRDTVEYRRDAADQDFEVALYSDIRRRQKRTGGDRSCVTAAAFDAELEDGSTTQCRKAAGLLMADIVRRKHRDLTGDIDYDDSVALRQGKSAPAQRDLAVILTAISNDSDWEDAGASQARRNVTPQRAAHLARAVDSEIDAPHHYLNADVIRRAVHESGDLGRVKRLIITDTHVDTSVEDIRTVKSGRQPAGGNTGISARMSDLDTGRGDGTYEMSDATVHNYRAGAGMNPDACGGGRIKRTTGEDYKKESKYTQARATNHADAGRPEVGKAAADTLRTVDNMMPTRLGGRLGTKYTVGLSERESGLAASVGASA